MPKKRSRASSGPNRLAMSAKEARQRFGLRPSKATLDKIRKRREAQSLVYERLKDMLLG